MTLPCSPPAFSLPLLLPLLLVQSSLSQSTLHWNAPQDPCYHPDGRPRHCLPEFINAAYRIPVQVAGPGGVLENVTSLTDLHNPHNISCWLGGPSGIEEWSLTIPLGRRFELTYISLQFCQSELQEFGSISILKSMDYGHSWSPLQNYSSQCQEKFGFLPHTAVTSRSQESEPLCSDPRPLQRHRGGLVLAFSTLDGRPSAPDFDYSPVLQDWVTATDIRVVFHKEESVRKKGAGSEREEGGALRWKAGSNAGRWNLKNKGVELGKDLRHWVKSPREVGLSPKGRGIKRKGEGLRTGKGNPGLKESGRGHMKGERLSPDKGELYGTHGQNITGTRGGSRTGRRSSATKGAGRGKGRGQKRAGKGKGACSRTDCHWSPSGGTEGSQSRELRRRRNHSPAPALKDLTQPSGVVGGGTQPPPASPPSAPLSLSDLQVGGRCKCNGHASRCRRDPQGRAVCQCEHGTAGPDCDICKPFYYDRPWQRATPQQPHQCVPCQCNQHSSRCRFSMELYQLSGRRSGGVCMKCRHHTTGQHCHYCQEGYTRDHGKPISHRKACRPCSCHPVGALGRSCNQTTGQCRCREGVTGVTCSRCDRGYQQSRSPTRPCVRIQEVVTTTPVFQPQYSAGEGCDSYCQPPAGRVRMNLRTYCLKEYVLKAHVQAMERSGSWWQFSVSVLSVFRSGTPRVRRGAQAVWVPERDLGCGCPALQVGRTFLLIGMAGGPDDSRLVADRTTLALLWRDHWAPKLRGLRGQARRGQCQSPLPPSAAPPMSSQPPQPPH
nr:PREDICTED: netrin-1-like [Lepisosteus oculatus]XP_015196325.1 PREDICTED: netrin-1-like [Lepisosteus oculatus]XP_015196326.1 PREDICTED: netrin-1-like [Lepisosteus oculatus]XP_015196327.1 PREDICTED: netrin-1-like [Lepisosteus oculatus]